MKKIMISQPINGLTKEQILNAKNKFLQFAQKGDLEALNTYFEEEWFSKEALVERNVVQIPVAFLAKSIEKMALCNIVYFAKGWEEARGCRIEHEIALQYGLKIIYEEALQLTFGQKAVGLNFNPSGNDAVDQSKQKFADNIDQLNDFRNSIETCQGAKRHASTAITMIEDAQMRTVKALTWKD